MNTPEATEKAFLMILDGWGLGKVPEVDAIRIGKTPFFDSLMEKYPHGTLVTFGENVGLPPGQMGNSEVGHLNIGAGRIVYQELARINKAIDEGTLAKEEELKNAISYAMANNKPIHILGLLSDGGVHSHINHISELAKISSDSGLEKVFIHAFTDGRDTDPLGGADYVNQLNQAIHGTNAKLASIIGRYYAMDRDKRWERTKLAYDLLVHGKGTQISNGYEALKASYDNDITDEFVKPVSVDSEGLIQEGDVVIFANFRTDRPRQLVTALNQEDLSEYGMNKMDLYFLTMTPYDETYHGVKCIYGKDRIVDTLGEVLDQHNLKQIRIAETEKYPHVTFFFSGGREEPFSGESRILIPSPKVATYDLAPEMSAFEVTDSIINVLEGSELPDFICLNFANADMVGHTGVMEAAIKAVEAVDECLRTIVTKAVEQGYHIIIIADHGNSDCMKNPDGSPHTAHTTNLVPVLYVSDQVNQTTQLQDGILADIAPTIMHLMKIPPSPLMTGKVLIDQ